MFAIVGAGRVGGSLALALARAGKRFTLLSRRENAQVGDVRAATFAEADLKGVRCVVLCVRDGEIGETAAALAKRLDDGGLVALHTSGIEGPAALSPFARARKGVWHPLCAVAEQSASAFERAWVSLEGDEGARARGEELAEAVGARPFTLDAPDRARYHAACVLSSNLLATLVAGAARLSPPLSVERLLPLARSALDALERKGVPNGLTGPATRGDTRTIARHLGALDGELLETYRCLTHAMLKLKEIG